MKLFIVGVFALVCTWSGAQTPSNVPDLDLSLSSVALEDIYFDTFQATNRAVPLPEADKALIKRLRDAIPPIHEPVYESISEAAKWLKPTDELLAYSTNGNSWAYPIRILNFHEIVNETLEGESVLISYCPLCFSGIVYSRNLKGKTLTFGNTSALYDSDMVMLDYETGSYWWQVAGKAIVGSLTGEQLAPLASNMISFQDWTHLHPNGLVLSRDTGFERPYERDSFAGYDQYLNQGNFAFPVTSETEQLLNLSALQPATRVLAVQLNDETKAYPLEENVERVIHDELAGQSIVVFQKGLSAAAFLKNIAGESMSFEHKPQGFNDKETQSSWDLAGRATEGDLKGSELPALSVKTSFWFAILGAEPEIEVYEEQ